VAEDDDVSLERINSENRRHIDAGAKRVSSEIDRVKRALSALNARLDQHEAMMKAEFAELRAEILFTTRPK
jgi:flagellar capping protein FliD